MHHDFGLFFWITKKGIRSIADAWLILRFNSAYNLTKNIWSSLDHWHNKCTKTMSTTLEHRFLTISVFYTIIYWCLLNSWFLWRTNSFPNLTSSSIGSRCDSATDRCVTATHGCVAATHGCVVASYRCWCLRCSNYLTLKISLDHGPFWTSSRYCSKVWYLMFLQNRNPCFLLIFITCHFIQFHHRYKVLLWVQRTIFFHNAFGLLNPGFHFYTNWQI